MDHPEGAGKTGGVQLGFDRKRWALPEKNREHRYAYGVRSRWTKTNVEYYGGCPGVIPPKISGVQK